MIAQVLMVFVRVRMTDGDSVADNCGYSRDDIADNTDNCEDVYISDYVDNNDSSHGDDISVNMHAELG
jgi:hypothetical protein